MSYREEEKLIHISIIEGVIDAKSASDLKALLTLLNSHKWEDNTRLMFLTGLLQGALFQFNKEESIRELNEIFKK